MKKSILRPNQQLLGYPLEIVIALDKNKRSTESSGLLKGLQIFDV